MKIQSSFISFLQFNILEVFVKAQKDALAAKPPSSSSSSSDITHPFPDVSEMSDEDSSSTISNEKYWAVRRMSSQPFAVNMALLIIKKLQQ